MANIVLTGFMCTGKSEVGRRLAKRHGSERLDAACARALAAGARSYRHVESILKHGLDRLPLDDEPAPIARPVHANVRGPAYYEPSDPEGDRPC